MKRIDLHIHTVHSDGSDTVPELLQRIEKENISVFSVTDHDTLRGIREVLDAKSLPAHFIPGVEFSCSGKAGKCHILGYGFDPNHPALLGLVEDGLARRKAKLKRRLTHLKERHGITFPNEEETFLYSLNAAGKPHLASLLIAHGHAGNKQEAIDRFLTGIPGGDDRTDAQKAIDTIHAAGGLAVFAHPIGGEDEGFLSAELFMEKFARLFAMGIDGLECAYSRYGKSERKFLLDVASYYGRLVSGGSDYHGKNKDIPLGKLSSDGSDPTFEELTILQRLGLSSGS